MKLLKVITAVIALVTLFLFAYVIWGNYSVKGKLEFRGEAGIALWFFSILGYCFLGVTIALMLTVRYLKKKKTNSYTNL